MKPRKASSEQNCSPDLGRTKLQEGQPTADQNMETEGPAGEVDERKPDGLGEDLFDFFVSEIRAVWPAKPFQQAHAHNAAQKLNLVAQALGPEATRSRLFPLLNAILADERTHPALILSIVRTLSSKDDNLVRNDPELVLELLWEHLLSHEEPTVRYLANVCMKKAIAKILVRNSAGLDEIFRQHVSESVTGDLSRTSYLKTVAGIEFCSECGLYLRKEDLERLARHPSQFVRIALLKSAIPAFVGKVDDVELIAELLLLNDKTDAVVLEGVKSASFGLLLKARSSNETTLSNSPNIPSVDVPVGLLGICLALSRAEFYKIRMTLVESLVHVLSESDGDFLDKLSPIVAKVIEERLTEDQETIVKRQALTSITNLTSSRHAFAVLRNMDTKRLLGLMSDLGKLTYGDPDTSLCLAKADLSLFKFDKNLVTLDDIFMRLEKSEENARIHFSLVETLCESNFLLGLHDDGDRIQVLKRLLQCLKVEKNPENAFDVSCWRSVCLCLERTSALIDLFSTRDIWRRDCRGSDFIEKCLIYPAHAVGLACTNAIEDCIELLPQDWIIHDILPAITRVSLVYSAPLVQSTLILACEKLLSSPKASSEETVVKVIEGVILKAMKSKSPGVRLKAAALGHALFQSPLAHSETLLSMWPRFLELEADFSVRRELDRALRRKERRQSVTSLS